MASVFAKIQLVDESDTKFVRAVIALYLFSCAQYNFNPVNQKNTKKEPKMLKFFFIYPSERNIKGFPS